MVRRASMKVGYARVSSVGQSLDVQIEKLEAVGCEKIFQEKRSGADSKRQQLATALEFVREGDVLVVSRLDRLARSTLHLCQIAEQLQGKGVALQVIDQAINTADATGRLLFNMLGAIAQFETEIRAERQADGIAKAQQRGVKFGRKAALDNEQVKELQQLRASGQTIAQLQEQFNLSRTGVYNYLKISA